MYIYVCVYMYLCVCKLYVIIKLIMWLILNIKEETLKTNDLILNQNYYYKSMSYI